MQLPSGTNAKAYGRAKESSIVLDTLNGLGASDSPAKRLFLFHGRKDIGKTTLIGGLSSEIAELELPGVAAVNLEDRSTYDFFEKLLEMGRTFRASPFRYDIDAFDFAALNFDLQFRNGRNSSLSLADTQFGSANIVSNSISDAIKAGSMELIDKIGKTGIWGLLGGGAVAIATGPALMAAAKAALVGGVAISSIQLIRTVLGGAWEAARRQSLFQRSESLQKLFSKATRPSFDDYQELLPRILAEDVSRAATAYQHFAVCISLDSSDHLASITKESAGRELAECLSQFINHLDKGLILAGARLNPETWRERAFPVSSTKELRFFSVSLTNLRVAECKHEIAALCPSHEERKILEVINQIKIAEIEPKDFWKFIQLVQEQAEQAAPYAD